MWVRGDGPDADFTTEYRKDEINAPAHYTFGGIETIDYIEAKGFSYHIGTVVKYLSRAGLKTYEKSNSFEAELKDLKKARWFLERYIKLLENCK